MKPSKKMLLWQLFEATKSRGGAWSTKTGVPPLTLDNALRSVVQSYSMDGNTYQNGIPTPTSPLEIKGVGDRTENLFNKRSEINTNFNGAVASLFKNVLNADGTIGVKVSWNYTYLYGQRITLEANKTYTMQTRLVSKSADATSVKMMLFNLTNGSVVTTISMTENNTTYYSSFIAPVSGDYVFGWVSAVSESIYETSTYSILDNCMLTIGDNGIVDEYNIQIKVNDSPSTIYIQSPIRKIGVYKDVLDADITRNVGVKLLNGTEAFTEYTRNHGFVSFKLADAFISTNGRQASLCTHFVYYQFIGTNLNQICFSIGGDLKSLYFVLTDDYTIDSFKSLLSAQYAVGTPVTIYYPLSTPTTESVTTPTLSTTAGTNYVDVNTIVKPSNMSITYMKQ